MRVLAVLPCSFSPFINVIVSALGYRSKPPQAILVDDSAYQRLNALTTLYNQKPKACLVMIGSQKMWHLREGTIILQGIGKQTYVSVGSTLPPQPFLPSQVMALPFKGLREKCWRTAPWRQTGQKKQEQPKTQKNALPKRKSVKTISFSWRSRLERAKGFEPSTPTLARLCSTPELRPRSVVDEGFML